MWNGMWSQSNIGCILFGRTHFPFRFSDDLNDFVLDRGTFILPIGEKYRDTQGRCSSVPCFYQPYKALEDLKYEGSLPPLRS